MMPVFKSFVGRKTATTATTSTNVDEHSSSSSSVQGKRSASPTYRPPSVVTSTVYDDDTYFQSVARALFFHFENEGLTERKAIELTLKTTEDKRGFLESLDLRSSNMYSNVNDAGEFDATGINETVERVRTTFGESLRLLWREAITGYCCDGGGDHHHQHQRHNDHLLLPSSFGDEAMMDHENDDPSYRRPLKTPKNLYSPIEGITTTNEQTNTCSLMPKSSGRQRRQFFPDTSEHPVLRPRLFFEFKIASGQQVDCLKLDGPSSGRGYTPPSPISIHGSKAL